MSGRIEYSIVQIADSLRDEKLNAGLIFFSPEGLDVRVPKKLDKLRAISQDLNIDGVRESLLALREVDGWAVSEGMESAEARINLIKSMTQFSFSSLGSFSAPTSTAYEEGVSKLLRILVEPEPAKAKPVRKRTRLVASFKAALRAERILAQKDEGLDAHRVVSNLQIADGLAADFVLKNGAMHVIETVDASADDASLRKAVSDIAVSALVLEQARMRFGVDGTRSRLVYEASATMERLTLPSLEAAAHQGAELINWASHDERRKFLAGMAMLAEPIPTKKEKRLIAVDSGAQGRFSLN